jgi:hypothetical protein
VSGALRKSYLGQSHCRLLLPEPHVQGAIQLHSGAQFVASQRALTLLAVKTAQAQMAMGEKGAHPWGVATFEMT